MSEQDEAIYQLKNVPIFEAMYGKGLISLGGYHAVNQLFKDVDINHKHLLDIGSGIGGIAHHLATYYQAQVIGLEIYPWMAQYAKDTAPENIKDQVNFIVYNEDGSIPLPSNSIDIVYSKGVLTNVKNKKALFKEIARVLKPLGEIYLVDWLLPENIKPNQELLTTGEPSYKETQYSYTKNILEPNGFKKTTFKNVSEEYLQYVIELDRLLCSHEHQEKYKDIISPELRNLLLNSNKQLIEAITAKKQYSFHIHAIKS